MNRHSWYVQQLAHIAWQKCSNTLKNEQLEQALEEVMNANSPFFIQLIEGMSKTQIALLTAIGKGETKLTASATMKKYPIGTPNNIRKNKIYFIEKDIIQQTESTYEFLDPVFELWFKQKFC